MAKPAQRIQNHECDRIGVEDSCSSKASLGAPCVLGAATVPQGLKTRMQQRAPLSLMWSELQEFGLDRGAGGA